MERVFCIPVHLYELMKAHVEDCLPEEGCGLLGGKTNQAELAIPVTNANHSAVSFFMDPFEQLRAMKAIESQGLDVIAIFHSHPDGPAHPSMVDLREFAYPGAVSLIWSRGEDGWKVAGFWIEAGEAAPVEIIIQRNPEESPGF